MLVVSVVLPRLLRLPSLRGGLSALFWIVGVGGVVVVVVVADGS